MAVKPIDAFILYNGEEQEKVKGIIGELEARGLSTYFWDRDIPIGESIDDFENQQLSEARVVLVILGEAGWGPTHLRLTKSAQESGKRILPILLGNPNRTEFSSADGLFENRRYLDLRHPTPEAFDVLASRIRESEPPQSGNQRAERFDRIIMTLVDGNEEQRADLLGQIQMSKSLDKRGLAARLREEIEGPFSPGSEGRFLEAVRNPKTLSSIRSWMLSSLIWADAEDGDSRAVILRHVREEPEPDRTVRYWTLAGLFLRKPSYLKAAVEVGLRDPAPEVLALAQAIADPESRDRIEEFRSKLLTNNFEMAWPVLRFLRVVPIKELAEELSKVLGKAVPGSPIAYDALYAGSQAEMAGFIAPLLAENPGPEHLVRLVIAAARESNRNASRNFAVLLAAFDYRLISRLLQEAESDAENRNTARILRGYVDELQGRIAAEQVRRPGYASDTIDIKQDELGIQEDVQTLTAVILAKDVTPPLAIGLFGDWGSGKSFFMRSMRAAIEDLAGRSTAPDSLFCSSVAQIEFNAWHYHDTNLYASLVSYILERLAAYVTPEKSEEEQQTILLGELGSAKQIVAEAEAEKEGAQNVINERQQRLQELQNERRQKELKLRDLRAADLLSLLSNDQALKTELEQSLNKIGVSGAVKSVSDLSNVVSEAYTVRGQLNAIFISVVKSRNRGVLVPLLIFALFVIPLLLYLARKFLITDTLMASATAIVAEISAAALALKIVVQRAVTTAQNALAKVTEAKQKVETRIAEKREQPSDEETQLQNEIAALKAKEDEVSARVAAAAARVVELEERIRAIKEGRSLARFLAERTSSEDYRKHLGLISTIRRDFESLATRLEDARANPTTEFRAADRIVLYIDDLDRCPGGKVMDVLQAVHLLLAYPLFVVVVGVDPRWLLHSLGTTYTAFESDTPLQLEDAWRSTPQNYLEKIFQIPFNLRPMTNPGYAKLMSKLLLTESDQDDILSGDARQTPETGLGSSTNTEVNGRGRSGGLEPAPDVAGARKADSQSAAAATDSEEAEGAKNTSTDEREDEKVVESKPSQTGFVIQEDALIIKKWESDFAGRLFELIPSPRAAKRFANVYRILKARVRQKELPRFEGSEEVPGHFQIPMVLLALLIRFPTESAILFPKLYQAARAEELIDLVDIITQTKPKEFSTLGKLITPIVSDGSFPDTPEVFAEWLPRVARFSFEVGRLVQPTE